MRNKVGKWELIKLGVRYECVLSPEIIMRENIDGLGIQAVGYTITNLPYADDTVLIDLQ